MDSNKILILYSNIALSVLWTREFSFASFVIVVVQSLSRVQFFATPWSAAHQPSLSFTISWSLLRLMSIESLIPSNHLILCHPFVLLPSIFPSIRVFSSESALCIRWPKDWSFSFSISPSNEYSGWISFRIEWFDLLAVQRTLKSLLQHHSSKASILQRSVFFMVSLFREASLQIPLVWCSVCGVGCAEYLCASLWRDVNFGSGWILTLNQI